MPAGERACHSLGRLASQVSTDGPPRAVQWELGWGYRPLAVRTVQGAGNTWPCGHRVGSTLPWRELDVIRVVVGAQVQNSIEELDPLHLQHFHI